MKLTKLCAIALAAIAMTSVAHASHSASSCPAQPEVVDAGVATLYIVNEATGTWIYLETNGHGGLQRGGAGWYELGTGNGVDDCWDRDLVTGELIEDPDMIIL
ncbi:MAG TPA: hypothetical protein VFH78_10660 [Candidatus Thermoplasmatota archaeon]|nr:hypothetical protein [Candidatus Thermoplasmatota archaeon]